MKALILGAGYATRLYPLTKNFPKPLLEVAGKPMADHLLDRLSGLPVDAVYLVTNRKFAGMFGEWGKARNVQVIDDGTTNEDNRLGAIGDIAFAIKEAKIDDDLLIVAGDNLFDFSLEPFVETFKRVRAPVIGLYEFPNRELLSKYGIVELDTNGKVAAFQEKPETPRSNLVAMCLYLFGRGDLGEPANYLAEPDAKDAPGHLISWLSAKRDIYGHVFRGRWYDIGDLQSLESARTQFKVKNN